ncbi:MAG: alpha-ribazole phosphatase family protein [Rikenellaceae bacterium]
MIYFLRHTRPNIKAGICYGITDLDLDPKSYVADIAQIKEGISEVKFDAIYSSPLKRCRQAAEAIASESEIILDARLKEMDFGEWEMMRWSEIFEAQSGKEWFANYINCPTPRGESFSNLVHKAKSFIEEVKDKKGDILVVTHAGFIRAAMVASLVAPAAEIFDRTIEYGEIIKLDI